MIEPKKNSFQLSEDPEEKQVGLKKRRICCTWIYLTSLHSNSLTLFLAVHSSFGVWLALAAPIVCWRHFEDTCRLLFGSWGQKYIGHFRDGKCDVRLWLQLLHKRILLKRSRKQRLWLLIFRILRDIIPERRIVLQGLIHESTVSSALVLVLEWFEHTLRDILERGRLLGCDGV